jgi:hypothetical protein
MIGLSVVKGAVMMAAPPTSTMSVPEVRDLIDALRQAAARAETADVGEAWHTTLGEAQPQTSKP